MTESARTGDTTERGCGYVCVCICGEGEYICSGGGRCIYIYMECVYVVYVEWETIYDICVGSGRRLVYMW